MSAKPCTCNEPRFRATYLLTRTFYPRPIRRGPFRAALLFDEKQGTRLLRRTIRVAVVGGRLVESVKWQDVTYSPSKQGHRRDCPSYVSPRAHVARKRRKPWWKDRWDWVSARPRGKPGHQGARVLMPHQTARAWYKPHEPKPIKRRDRRGQTRPRSL